MARLAVLAMLAGLAFSASPDDAGAKQQPSVRVLRVPFWMDAGAGDHADTGLHARLDGRDVKARRVLDEQSDLVILLVLDLAGDIAEADPARQAILETLPELRLNTWVGLLRAQDGLKVLADPTADREQIGSIVRGLTIAGRAGFLDSVDQVAQIGDAVAGTGVRTAVLYVTDSSVGNYREDFSNPVVNSGDSRDLSRRFPEGLVKERIQRVLARLRKHQTPIFIAHLNYRSDRLNEAYQTGLLEIATATGGEAVFCRTVGEIPDTVKAMFRSISKLHFAEIEVPGGASRKIAVEMSAFDQPLRSRTQFQTEK